jgi:ABC-type branched-subunit amino acid transport system substrate-binding protein
MGWQPSYHAEATIYAKYLLREWPNTKIAVLYQNDDYGKDYLSSLRQALGTRLPLIVKEASYEVSDPSIDSQIVSLRASGAEALFIFATPKFAAQAIRRSADIGWRPLTFLNNVSSSVATVLQPAGLERSIGIVTALYLKDPTDPQWSKDKAFRDWSDWMKKYYPQGDLLEIWNVYGYSVAQTLVHVLKQCGDDLTRENIMRQAASIKSLELPMLLPGIRLATGPEDWYPIEQLQLARFDGRRWVLFGEVLSGESR